MQTPQILINIAKRLKAIGNWIVNFVNSVGRGICNLCGIIAVAYIMAASAYFISLLGASAPVILLAAGITPIVFGGYKSIFDKGYNIPKSIYNFITSPITSIKKWFKPDLEEAKVQNEPPMTFIDRDKSFCSSFLPCFSFSTTLTHKNTNSVLQEQEKDEEHSWGQSCSKDRKTHETPGGYSI